MHPEIKKFWIEAGYILIGGQPPTYIWEIHINLGISGLGIDVYRMETVCHGNKYRFNKEWYSEEEALKIVKLKAFL
jgi:hypothetical protein